MKNDQSGTKVDLYFVLKRRKRTVADFLSENNLKNFNQIKKFVETNFPDVLLSEEFIKEAKEFLSRLEDKNGPIEENKNRIEDVRVKRHNKKPGV
jgi:predicted nuclease with TOPRIM domain